MKDAAWKMSESERVCLVGCSQRALTSFGNVLQDLKSTGQGLANPDIVFRLVTPYDKTNLSDCSVCILVADGDQSRLLISNTARSD